MQQTGHWESHARPAYRTAGRDPLRIWAWAAVFVSLALHLLAFFALDHVKIALAFREARDLRTGSVRVDRVEVKESDPEEMIAPDHAKAAPDTAPLMQEVDLLKHLPKNAEIDIKPNVLTPEYALRMEKPAQAGAPAGNSPDPAIGADIQAELPELGHADIALPPAASGQLVVDPGTIKTDIFDPNRVAEQWIRKGAGGKADKGAMDGMTTLDDMLGLPANALTNTTTLLPSDLLFEYNRAELRESARVGLMKLALLIERNPELYCWIEGNTDLIGGDDFNLELSRKRAESVKSYLVRGLHLNPAKIITRGFGKSRPLVPSGNAEEQALNRRVEIRMRKSPPGEADAPPATPHPAPHATAVDAPAATPRATPVEPTPPRATTVDPVPAEPVTPAAEPVAPRATPAEPVAPAAEPVAPRAMPAEPDNAEPATPRAAPVDETPAATPQPPPTKPKETTKDPKKKTSKSTKSGKSTKSPAKTPAKPASKPKHPQDPPPKRARPVEEP